MSQQKSHGSCLCGEVSYRIEGPYLFFQCCHCSRCRKAGGSGNAANLTIPADQLIWLSGRHQSRRYAKQLKSCQERLDQSWFRWPLS